MHTHQVRNHEPARFTGENGVSIAAAVATPQLAPSHSSRLALPFTVAGRPLERRLLRQRGRAQRAWVWVRTERAYDLSRRTAAHGGGRALCVVSIVFIGHAGGEGGVRGSTHLLCGPSDCWHTMAVPRLMPHTVMPTVLPPGATEPETPRISIGVNFEVAVPPLPRPWRPPLTPDARRALAETVSQAEGLRGG